MMAQLVTERVLFAFYRKVAAKSICQSGRVLLGRAKLVYNSPVRSA